MRWPSPLLAALLAPGLALAEPGGAESEPLRGVSPGPPSEDLPARSIDLRPHEGTGAVAGATGIGDVDGDAVLDLIALSVDSSFTILTCTHSGATGELLGCVPTVNTLLIGVVPDETGDGVLEFAATTLGVENAVYDGATRQRIRPFSRPSALLEVNGSATTTVDLDGDGFPDFVWQGRIPASDSAPERLMVEFMSSATGQIIVADEEPGATGRALACGVGDRGGDGKDEVVLVYSMPDGGSILKLADSEGKEGWRIASVFPQPLRAGQGFVAATTDHDGDGALDIVYPSTVPGQPLPIRSSADGSLIGNLGSTEPWECALGNAALGQDLTDDGFPDAAVYIPGGAIRVLDLATGERSDIPLTTSAGLSDCASATRISRIDPAGDSGWIVGSSLYVPAPSAARITPSSTRPWDRIIPVGTEVRTTATLELVGVTPMRLSEVGTTVSALRVKGGPFAGHVLRRGEDLLMELEYAPEEDRPDGGYLYVRAEGRDERSKFLRFAAHAPGASARGEMFFLQSPGFPYGKLAGLDPHAGRVRLLAGPPGWSSGWGSGESLEGRTMKGAVVLDSDRLLIVANDALMTVDRTSFVRKPFGPALSEEPAVSSFEGATRYASGDVLAWGKDRSQGSALWRIDRHSGARTRITGAPAEGFQPDWAAVSAKGDIYLAAGVGPSWASPDSWERSLFLVDPATGERTEIYNSHEWSDSDLKRFLVSRDGYIVAALPSAGGIWRLDPRNPAAGFAQLDPSSTEDYDWIAPSPDLRSAIARPAGEDRLVRLDLDTGASSPVPMPWPSGDFAGQNTLDFPPFDMDAVAEGLLLR